MYTVKFADNELTSLVKVEKINRTVIPTRENFSKSIPTMHGSYYTGYKYNERIIEIEIGMTYKNKKEYTEKVRKLADMLDVTNPSKLIISDEPDKYYYAVPDGDIALEKLFDVGAKATIKFICHDPIAYSNRWKVFVPDSKKIVTVRNEGTVETFPIVEADFRKSACFFQVTNAKGETVLVGKPKDATQPTVPLTDVVVDDDCTSSGTFTSIADSLLDPNRLTDGHYGVGFNGNGMTCTNYGNSGEENKWHGAGFKRNLNANVSEFEVEIDLIFSSEGEHYVIPPEPPIPPPPPDPPTPENPKPPPPPVTEPSYGTYEVFNCGGLWINATPDTSKPLYAIAPGDKVYPVEFNGKWARHTHTNVWGNTFTGWSHTGYLRKISDSIIRSGEKGTLTEGDYAGDEVGTLEVYGYDQNGAKLFKMEVADNNQYYEYVEPRIFIGSQLVVDDGKNCPSPKKINIRDDNGKITGEREVESGAFGEWNDLTGKIIVRREKNSSGQFLWNATIYKYVNGQIVNSMTTQNSLSSDSYPKGDLNYLGFYIGKFGKNRQVDVAVIDNIKVKKLNTKTDENIGANLSLFMANDHLQIDFNKGLVKINNQVYLNALDIGSEFFSIPSGSSQFAIRTDDDTAVVCSGIQEKYL